MATLDFDTDPTLTLLTDALRAGPGTPVWRDAVAKLREHGGDQADEYLLLCTAREHLASGRSFREIHAGPGFTRKLMESVEQDRDGGAARVAPSAGVIAWLSALVVIAIVGAGGYVLWRNSKVITPPPRADLSAVLFTETVLDAPLISTPAGWKTVGTMPLTFDNGLRPGAAPAGDQEFVGGAILSGEPLPASTPAQVDVALRLPAPDSSVVAQVFVTDDPALSESRATSPHELTWSYRNGEASVVLPAGRAGGEVLKPEAKQQRMDVRIQFEARSAVIVAGGRTLWSGEHGLDAAKPRYVGLRFLAPSGSQPDAAASFSSISIKKPRTP